MDREDCSVPPNMECAATDLSSQSGNVATAEDTTVEEDRKAENGSRKAPRRRFHIFHHRHKKPTIPTDPLPLSHDDAETPKPAHSTLGDRASQLQEEERERLTQQLIRPSRVLPSDGDGCSAPPLRAPAEEVGDGDTVGAIKEYIVQVTLDSGHDLAIRDRSGSSDPYVKLKHGHFKYRSAFINQSLNPQWNEIVSFKTTDLTSPLQIQVFDHDYGSADDFMGAASVNLAEFMDGELHMTDVGLSDPSCSSENLGYLRLFIKIDPCDLKATTKMGEESAELQDGKKMAKSIITVTLLNGTDLPSMNRNDLSDPYCKFKLGSQKYKSKVKFKTLNPQWKEQFDFRMFEGDDVLHVEVWDRDFPSADDYMGSCKVELGSLVPDKTYDLTLPLVDSGCGSIHLLLCISGMAVNEVDECDGPQNVQTEENYNWRKTLNLKAIKDVGHLKVKIHRISGVNMAGNTSLFATLEVGNSQMRTDIYKSPSHTWSKTFCFNIKDIHDDLEVTVYNERKTGKNEFVGKVIIPLLWLHSGTAKMYALKDKHGITKAKAGGVLVLECDLVYNHIRAAVRTFKPREMKMMNKEDKFNRKVLMSNIRRATHLARTLLSTWGFIQSLWSWEDKWLSAISFFLFIIACLFGELWMVFPLLILLLLYGYMVVYVKGHHLWQIDSRRKLRQRGEDDEEESSMEELEESELEDEDDPTNEDQSKAGISQKFKQLQRVLLLLQTLLGKLADIGERMYNFYNWRVPWLCWLAISLLAVTMVIVYTIPLRYIILAWGVNKFTKRLRSPNYVPNQELLDFISRSPTHKQLLQWSTVSHRLDSKRLMTQLSASDNKEGFISTQAITLEFTDDLYKRKII